jgi:hypothetical protein
MEELSIEEMMAASADLLQAIEDEGLVDMPDSPSGIDRKSAMMSDELTIDDEREVSVSFDVGECTTEVECTVSACTF